MLGQWEGGSQLFGSMAPSRRDCRLDMIFLSGYLLLSVLGFHPALAKVCNWLHNARSWQQLVHEGWWEPAHYGPDADEWISADEQHQSRHRAGRPAGHPAHPRVQAVLPFAHHQNLRHGGKCVRKRLRVRCGAKLRAVCFRRALRVENAIFLWVVRCLAIVSHQMFGGGKIEQVCTSEVYKGFAQSWWAAHVPVARSISAAGFLTSVTYRKSVGVLICIKARY